jgi:hypothetical protein
MVLNATILPLFVPCDLIFLFIVRSHRLTWLFMQPWKLFAKKLSRNDEHKQLKINHQTSPSCKNKCGTDFEQVSDNLGKVFMNHLP